MDINITLKAPDLSGAIQSLADAIVAVGCIPARTALIESTIPNAELIQQVELTPDEAQVKDTPTSTDTTVTIPTVVELRAKAQEKSGTTAEGKQAIKALLDKYESKSISSVPEEKRVAFMADLQAL